MYEIKSPKTWLKAYTYRRTCIATLEQLQENTLKPPHKVPYMPLDSTA